MTCPDPGQIAAHVDRRLTAVEAARMDEHIAGCADCTQVFADTVEFGLAEGEAAGVHRAADPAAGTPRSVVPQSWLRLAAGLVMAAGLAGFLGWFTLSSRRHVPTPVAQLAEAVGTRRFVEPRLTGGFAHGRLVVLRSGETSQKLDAQPAAVIAAVAKIRAQAEGDTSPKTLGALAITYLVSGDVAAAVKALESATAQEPDNPGLLSDLAAAYIARAEQMDEPADLPKALEVAEKAIILKDPPIEVWFNRALALEKLHLVDAARKAWDDYLERDAASGWADEARQHRDALPTGRQSSVEEDKARVRAALEGGQAAVDQLADEDPSLLRDYFEDDLLPAWAEAHLVGHPKARLYREQAQLVGDALLRTTTDALAKDTSRALVEPAAPASRDPLRSQALGYRALHEAKRLYDFQEPSCAQYGAAHRDLAAGGSPYSAWATQQVVSACLYSTDPPAALAELDRMDALVVTRHYLQLQARIRWLQGLLHGQGGELTDALDLYGSAATLFAATRDSESQATVFGLRAESLRLLGDRRGAWRERAKGLALLDKIRNPRRRHGLLGDAVLACLDEGMPRTALPFGSAHVAAALTWSRAVPISDALLRRAAIRQALGEGAAAAADVQAAREWHARTSDRASAVRLEADANALEGELLLARQPEAAAASLERAIDHFREHTPERLPALQLLLARAQSARGLDEAAERGLLAGIQEVERQRISMRGVALQRSFFDQAFPLFEDMVRLQITRRHDPGRALAFVERGRARQLVDELTAHADEANGVVLASASLAQPLEPAALQAQLSEGVALVYFLASEDALYSWTLTRHDSHFLERPLRAAVLQKLVAAHRQALEGRASLAVVHRTGAQLHDELVRPLLPYLASRSALILVPDALVQGVAFSSLWNRETGRYLIQDHVIGSAPSGTVFVHASSQALSMPRGATPHALVVGNPRVDRRVFAGLPNLPGAEAEAVEIAALYPGSTLLTRGDATSAAFLEGLAAAEVVHYAGHAVSSDDDSSAARLLLAPGRSGREVGPVLISDLGRQRLRVTRVVTLAACRTGAGPVSRLEGSRSLSRPFLAAGVPDVVASLWDIDDTVSRRVFVALHGALARGEEPLIALRAVQLALLAGPDASLAHPSTWAAFVCAGGLSLHSFPKGEPS